MNHARSFRAMRETCSNLENLSQTGIHFPGMQPTTMMFSWFPNCKLQTKICCNKNGDHLLRKAEQKLFLVLWTIGSFPRPGENFEHQGRAATSYPVVHGSTDVGAVMSIMILDHLRDLWHCEQDYEQMSNDANWVHESCIYKAAFLLFCWPLAIWANQEPTAITCSLKWRAKCLFGIDKEAILASHFVVQIQWLPHGHYIAELKFAISLKVLLFVKPFYLFSWRSQRSLSPNYTTLLPG